MSAGNRKLLTPVLAAVLITALVVAAVMFFVMRGGSSGSVADSSNGQTPVAEGEEDAPVGEVNGSPSPSASDSPAVTNWVSPEPHDCPPPRPETRNALHTALGVENSPEFRWVDYGGIEVPWSLAGQGPLKQLPLSHLNVCYAYSKQGAALAAMNWVGSYMTRNVYEVIPNLVSTKDPRYENTIVGAEVELNEWGGKQLREVIKPELDLHFDKVEVLMGPEYAIVVLHVSGIADMYHTTGYWSVPLRWMDNDWMVHGINATAAVIPANPTRTVTLTDKGDSMPTEILRNR